MIKKLSIWVIGRQGNEEKSLIQSYIQSLYVSHRVARFDITNKKADLLHIMSRCALAATDIFLFNDQRCVPSEDCCYSLLEMLKDMLQHPSLMILYSESKSQSWLFVFQS